MKVDIRVPAVGESVTEGVIAQWLKNEGDSVAIDEPICSLETDKVSVDVPAPAAGTIVKLLAAVGDTVAVGAIIAEMDQGAAPSAAAPAAAPAESHRVDPQPGGPAARKHAGEHGLDAAKIAGTGKGGRLTKADVLAAVEISAKQGAAQPTAIAPSAVVVPPAPPITSGPRAEQRITMTPLRKRLAQRLVQAQQTAAILTTFNEADMSGAMALRQRYQDAFTAKYGIKLGFMSLFVKAAVEALKAFPAVNAEIDGDTIVYKDYYDIGVAVGGGKGLVVPVIRNAEALSFAEVEKTIADFGTRARANKLRLDELSGGTFTISNGGIYGSLLSTPIINPPQSGILGMHTIQKRPVVVGDQVVIRPMMYLALSYDHRLVDGREAVSFLIRIKECIEAPERMLFEV